MTCGFLPARVSVCTSSSRCCCCCCCFCVMLLLLLPVITSEKLSVLPRHSTSSVRVLLKRFLNLEYLSAVTVHISLHPCSSPRFLFYLLTNFLFLLIIFWYIKLMFTHVAQPLCLSVCVCVSVYLFCLYAHFLN